MPIRQIPAERRRRLEGAEKRTLVGLLVEPVESGQRCLSPLITARFILMAQIAKMLLARRALRGHRVGHEGSWTMEPYRIYAIEYARRPGTAGELFMRCGLAHSRLEASDAGDAEPIDKSNIGKELVG